MHRIFISYRRSEAAFAAGALGRELKQYFGEAQVFRDREDVEGGMSWRAQVLSAIDRESALLVLIDEHWLEPAAGRDKPRLFDPDDPVRLEILDALQDGATIIPLLLDGAPMPPASALPAEIQAISEINALPLRDGDWRSDVTRVCVTLEHIGFVAARRHRYAGIGPVVVPQRADTFRPVAVAGRALPTGRGARRALLSLLVAAALAVAAWLSTVRSHRVPHALVAVPPPAQAGAASQPTAAPQSAAGSSTSTFADAGVHEPSQPAHDAVVGPPKTRARSSMQPNPVRPVAPAEQPVEPAQKTPPPAPPANPLDMKFQ